METGHLSPITLQSTSRFSVLSPTCPVLFQNRLCKLVHKPTSLNTHYHTGSLPPPLPTATCPVCSRLFTAKTPSQIPWVHKGMQRHIKTSLDPAHQSYIPPTIAPEPTLQSILFATTASPVHFVNRLDRGTSGLVCVAASSASARAIQSAWHTARKRYVCMVRGNPEEKFTVDLPLKDKSKAAKVKGADAAKKSAVTVFEKIRTIGGEEGGFALVRATLIEGGRTHQIRRHLNSVGHQIVGDKLYGKSGINKWLEEEYGFGRMFLHAEELRVVVEGEVVEGIDPLENQDDLMEFLERFP